MWGGVFYRAMNPAPVRFFSRRPAKVEAKIFELQEAMADRGYSDAEIEEKVAEVRKGLEEREGNGQKASLLKGKKGAGAGGGAGTMDSHMRDVKKADDNRRMREAFGLGDDYAAGEAFDEEAQERKKETHRKEREAKDKEWEEKKAAKKAEEKKEKRRREKAASDDDQDGQEGGARKGSSRRGDSQEAERDSMMAKRAERFGASANEPRGSSNNDRKGRGQFRAGGPGNKNNDKRGGGRDGRDGDRRPSEMNVKDALAGGLSAPRGGSRRDRARSEDEGPRDVVIHVDGEDGGGRGRPRDRAEGSGRNVHVRVAGERGRGDSEDSRYRGDRGRGYDDDSDGERSEREVIVVTQSGVDENDRWQADGNGVFAEDGLGGGSAAPASATTTTPHSPADDDLRGRIKGRGRRGVESGSPPPRKKAALAPSGGDLRERISGRGRRGVESPPKKQRRKRSPSHSASDGHGTGGAGSPARPAKRAPAAEVGSDKRKRDGSRDSGGRGADMSRGGVRRSDRGRGGGERNGSGGGGGGGGKGGRRRSRSEESGPPSGPPAGRDAIRSRPMVKFST
ncbi:unnamed protein product [Ectocarpus sp. 12 AP-2014]